MLQLDLKNHVWNIFIQGTLANTFFHTYGKTTSPAIPALQAGSATALGPLDREQRKTLKWAKLVGDGKHIFEVFKNDFTSTPGAPGRKCRLFYCFCTAAAEGAKRRLTGLWALSSALINMYNI